MTAIEHIKSNPLFHDSPFWDPEELYNIKHKQAVLSLSRLRPVYRSLISLVNPRPAPVSTCLNPVAIWNPIYKMNTSTFIKNWKEWLEDPDAFEARNPFDLYVPCRKCPLCLKRKGSDWRVRLYHEFSDHPVSSTSHNYFVTFTFNEESYKEFGFPYGCMPSKEVLARPVKLFLDRYRKALVRKLYGQDLHPDLMAHLEKKYRICRHFFVYEHSNENTQRLHIHGIIFGCMFTSEELAEIWQYGFIEADDATDGRSQWSGSIKSPAKTVNYILKYLVKGYTNEDGLMCTSPVFVSPGIGSCFVRNSTAGFIKNGRPVFTISLNDSAYRVALPKYYQSKVFPKGFVKDFVASSPPPDYRCGKFSTDDFDQWLQYVNAIPAIQDYWLKLGVAKSTGDYLRDIHNKNSDELWEFFQKSWSKNPSIPISI